MTFVTIMALLASTLSSDQLVLTGRSGDETALYSFAIDEEQFHKIGPGRNDGSPRWSPDGDSIAFETDTDTGRGIGIIDAAGEGLTVVSNLYASNRWPRWSPDGKRLAYSSGTSPNEVIVVYDLETRGETVWGGQQTGLLQPVWLSTPSLLRSALQEDERYQSYSVESLSSKGLILAIGRSVVEEVQSTVIKLVTPTVCLPAPEELLDTPNNTYVEWSAEPSKNDRAIAYESNDGGDREIFIASKGKVFDVSNHFSTDWNPVWSPDGKWLIFESFREKRWGLYRVHRDTSRLFVVASEPGMDFVSPDWSADSENIISIIRVGDQHFLGMLTRGGELKKQFELPFSAASDPKWRPVR